MDLAGLTQRATHDRPVRDAPTGHGRLRVAFKSLGCRVNYEEAECLGDTFGECGWQRVPFEAEADVYVINTCTVTRLADAESRKQIRRAVRNKPDGGIVAVTGCYAQRDPEALRALEGVDLILGNVEKAQLFEHVRRVREDQRLAGDIWVTKAPRTQTFLGHGTQDADRQRIDQRTRATLKIQDGCNERCTYCIIPFVRGVSVSRDLGEVCDEASRLADRGFREIALTGVNTGSFGMDRGETDALAKLVRRLDGLARQRRAPHLRFRLNSLEPATVTPALLDAIDTAPSFARHFHVPMQHGDSQILRRMGRGYDTRFYEDIIRSVHARFPRAGIGADIMVGFPGETEEHFERACTFVDSLPLSYLHVFTYSERDGTPATRMPGQVDAQTKAARSRHMHRIEQALRRRFLARIDGTRESVLVERKRGPGGGLTGLTGNYARVELPMETAAEPSDAPAANEFWIVRIEDRGDPRLAGARPIRRDH